MTTPILYDSQDVGAPQITANNPQSFLNVIKACLVGVSGVAYGSKAPAGWTLPYEDVVNNKMVLRQGGGNQFYLRLGDPAVIQAGANNYGKRYVCVRGYEAMTGIDTGTGAFPTVPQVALNSYYWAFATNIDSGAAVTSTLPWTLVADDRFFYLIVFGSDAVSSYSATTTYFFGDIIPNKTDDAFHTIIFGNTDITTNSWNGLGTPNASTNGTASPVSAYCWKPFYSSGDPSTVIPGLYMSRAFNQIGSAKNVGMHTDAYKASQYWGFGNLAYPDQIDGGIYTSSNYVHENTGGNLIRGRLPGLYIPNHTRPLDHLTQFTGTGAFAGIPFVSLRNARPNQVYQLDSYNVFVQLTDWRV